MWRRVASCWLVVVCIYNHSMYLEQVRVCRVVSLCALVGCGMNQHSIAYEVCVGLGTYSTLFVSLPHGLNLSILMMQDVAWKPVRQLTQACYVGGRAFFLRIFIIFIFSERKRIHACHSEQSQDRTYKYTPFHLSPHACVIYAYYTQTSLSNTCFPIYRTQHKYSITWFDTLTPSRVT